MINCVLKVNMFKYWNMTAASNGIHQMVFIKWYSSNGIHQMVFIKWYSSNGIHICLVNKETAMHISK